MITAAAFVLIMLALLAAKVCWGHRLNPIFIGALVWAPGLILATVPREFLSPIYEHLNRDASAGVFLALLVSFVFFSAGVMFVLASVGRRGWDVRLSRYTVNVHDGRLALVFGIGFSVFLYSFAGSGLSDVINLDPEEVAESRLKLHLGPLSFVVLFLDITAVIFLAKMLETKRYLYALPMVMAIACQMSTLQKSRMMFLVLGAAYLFLLYPAASREMMFGTFKRRVVTISIGLIVLVSLFAMNALRGIGVIQMTSFESSSFEQVYIYSGATAILNLSSAIEGYVPSEPPKWGLVLARPITWHLVDRGSLNPTFYFEGINAATYLIYPWSDFRWLGFMITPFLTGLMITLYYWMSLRKTIYGLIFGVVAFEAVVFSVNTDVIFDPTTLILMVIAVATHLFAGARPLVCRPDPVGGRHGIANCGNGRPTAGAAPPLCL